MIELNWMAVLVAAIIPLLVGSIYYNPKVLGNAWMSASGMTEEMIQGSNMVKIFGLTLLFSLMLASSLMPVVIHQMGVYSIFANDPTAMDPSSETGAYLADFMAKYGDNFRTYRHGAIHGLLLSVFLVLPILGINSLFERKSAKYIFIHLGYWAISLTLMGAIICGWK